jgi:hypothetical protein
MKVERTMERLESIAQGEEYSEIEVNGDTEEDETKGGDHEPKS